MRLIEYLYQQRITQTDFAAEIGITKVYLGALLKGKSPGINLAKTIEAATKGAVTKEELLFPSEH